MCLENVTTTKPKVAKKDIVCYKKLRSQSTIAGLEDGDEVSVYSINNQTVVSSVVTIEGGKIYYCTNDKNLKGTECDDKKGFKYSWKHDCAIGEVQKDGKSIPMCITYETPYQYAKVEIGKTYESELILDHGEVYKGLHSYAEEESIKNDTTQVKCIIPKGSKYYEGYFNDDKAYASNKLKYVKIINHL